MNKKQTVFVKYYLQTWNATQSAIKAGYSKRSAGQVGHRLLKDDEIKAEIKLQLEALTMDADEVLARLADIARSDMHDVMDVRKDGGAQIDFAKAIRKKKMGMIKSISPTKAGVRVELHDKVRALELIGKNLNLFADKVNLTLTEPIKVIEIIKDHGTDRSQ
ncbi:MAG: terminase small subunit [Methylobacter sp.]